MTIHSDKVIQSVTRYEPGPLPLNQEDLGIYLNNELKRLGDVIFNQAIFRLERTNVVPDRPRAGDIRYFDGTNANPLNTGVEGLYFFQKGSPDHWVHILDLDDGKVALGNNTFEIFNDIADTVILKVSGGDGNVSIVGGTKIDFSRDGGCYIAAPGGNSASLIFQTGDGYNTRLTIGPTGTITVGSGGSIACADTVVSRPRFTDYSETVNAIGTKTAAFNIDLEDGNVQTLTLSGGGTFNIGITNALSSHSNSVTLLGTNLGSCTATFYAGAHDGGGNKVYWGDGDDTSNNLMTSSGTDVVTFTTFDGGTNFYGFVAGKGMTNS